MNKPNRAVADTTDREIVSSRILTANQKEVFRAFSDPVRLAEWWGPKGFTNNFQQFDFRAGGTWRFTMRGPDGASYEMDKHFTEITPPERIVIRHTHQTHGFLMTMTLTAQENNTKLTWRMCFDDPAECATMRPFIAPANEENFDRLAAHLARTIS